MGRPVLVIQSFENRNHKYIIFELPVKVIKIVNEIKKTWIDSADIILQKVNNKI